MSAAASSSLSLLWRSTGWLVGILLVGTLAGCGGGPTSSPVMPSAGSATSGAAPTADRPGADNTGVPEGIELKESDGLTIREDGTVVDGLDIDGCVVVEADDVVIQNSRIRCSDPDSEPAVRVLDGTNLQIIDTEIDGLGEARMGVGYSNYSLLRVEIHSVSDGARLGSNVTVEASWIHDLARQGDLHPDALQSTSGTGIVVRGNTLDCRGDDDLGNAAIMLGTELGDRLLKDAVFADNYLNGGNYTVNIRADGNLEDVTFSGNVYGADSRYGPVRSPDDVHFDDDTMEETGEPVEVDESR